MPASQLELATSRVPVLSVAGGGEDRGPPIESGSTNPRPMWTAAVMKKLDAGEWKRERDRVVLWDGYTPPEDTVLAVQGAKKIRRSQKGEGDSTTLTEPSGTTATATTTGMNAGGLMGKVTEVPTAPTESARLTTATSIAATSVATMETAGPLTATVGADKTNVPSTPSPPQSMLQPKGGP